MSLSNTRLARPVIVWSDFNYGFLRLTALSSVKAYGELPENAKINETDTFGEEDGVRTFEFGDEGEVDIDDI